MVQLLLLFSIFTSAALAADLNIIDVRRNITLADDEPVYKDFYISAGDESGMKKNQVLTIVRKVGIKDASGSQTLGELKIPVGQVKVLAIYPKIVVAREYRLFSRQEHPMLEQTGLMIGDQVDLKNPLPDQGPPGNKKREKSANLHPQGPI